MMKISTGILLLLFASVFFSCQEKKVVYESWVSTGEELQWSKSNILSTEIEVNDNSKPTELYVGVRYATGYAYDRLPLKMIQTAPDGKRTISQLDIPIRDKDGEFIGDKGFDIIDLEYLVNGEHSFPMHGKYTYSFEQTAEGIDPLHFVMELGILTKEKASKK
jgi:gliding motility-associated lipoprotein GldH